MQAQRSRSALALLGAAALASFTIASAQAQQDPIKIGLLEDQTGEIAIFTLPKSAGRSWPWRRSMPPAGYWAGRSS